MKKIINTLYISSTNQRTLDFIPQIAGRADCLEEILNDFELGDRY